MQVVHRDGVTLRFSTSAVSFAISKAFLRRRERELIRQKESYNVCRASICHELGHIYLEEEWYRVLFEQEQIDKELLIIKDVMKWMNHDDSNRIKELLLKQLRGLSRSTAMRFATDLSLIAMPTPPTEMTALRSLSCGRITYASV